MQKKLGLAVAAAFLLVPAAAEADWLSNWRVNLQLHQHWYMKPVDRFFAVNGPPQKAWDTVGGIAGLGNQYSWARRSCRVLIRISQDDRMESLNSYGACEGVVR